MRWIVIGIGLLMVASLAGFGQLAGLVALPLILLGILGGLLRSSRPTWRGDRRGSARTFGYLARYQSVDSPISLAGLALAAYATWDVLELLGTTSVSYLSVAVWLPVICLALAPYVTATFIGVAGSISVTVGLFFRREGCVETASPRALALYVATLILTVAIIVLRRRRGRALRIERHEWALATFGLLDVLAFVVHPTGLEIWQTAPWWAVPAVLGTVGILAYAGSYSPGLVVGLAAVGATFGEFVLAAGAAGTGGCGEPGLGLGFTVAFVVLAMAGLALRPQRSKQ